MYAELLTILQLCIKGNYLCERDTYPPLIKFEKLNPEDSCYKDGIFYPRCKDLENPEVWHYHNLLKNP